MKSIIDWTATPLGSAVLGYVLLGICTFLFKPKSPEEYAAMAASNPRWFFARWAAFWQFLGGLGLDPAKMATGMLKMITGQVRPVTFGSIPAPAMKKDDSEAAPYKDAMLPAVACLIGALSLLGLAPVIAACSSPSPATPEKAKAQREEIAGATYEGDLTKCGLRALYPTFEESKACSARVRQTWHRLPDGGADPAWFLADGGVR